MQSEVAFVFNCIGQKESKDDDEYRVFCHAVSE
jgi:hypothetical protein